MVPKHIRDGKNNMAMLAVDEFRGNGVGPIRLISSSAGRAKARLTAKSDKMKAFASMAIVKMVPVCGVPTVEHLIDLRDHNRANIAMLRQKSIPVVLKNLLDCKVRMHVDHPRPFYQKKSGMGKKRVQL